MHARKRERAGRASRSVDAVLREARSRLHAAGIGEASLDARRLVAHALGTEPSRLVLEGRRLVGSEMAAAIDRLVAKRLEGWSVARLVGRRAFHGIDLLVAPDVLEPRDDTGALVDLVLDHAQVLARRRDGPVRLLDIGTGSGAVALACLAAEPRLVAIGTDLSDDALALAGRNALNGGVADRFRAVRADLARHLSGTAGGRFDIVASNPPYIPTAEITSLAPEVLRDPTLALDGGEDGLDIYRRIAAELPQVVAPDGVLAVEIGAGQGEGVRAIMRGAGWREIEARADLGGHERALAFRPEGAA